RHKHESERIRCEAHHVRNPFSASSPKPDIYAHNPMQDAPVRTKSAPSKAASVCPHLSLIDSRSLILSQQPFHRPSAFWLSQPPGLPRSRQSSPLPSFALHAALGRHRRPAASTS